MRKKRTLLVLMTIIVLVLPSFLVSAASNESSKVKDISKNAGEFASKDEVVYATLDATGKQEEMYIVNIFDVVKEGKIVDFGSYSSLKNLTDLSEIEQNGDKVQFPASKGKFYYQGNQDSGPLPWDIGITYLLDGSEVVPEQLAGKNGHIEIVIETFANDKVDKIFFENYLLQISLTLDPVIYSNIEAPSGMIANAGKNKQITFTVMPEKEEELKLEADVKDFELKGIEITAVPSSFSIDPPDVDSMTDDMESLSDAIGEVNNGVASLNDGISQLNNGVISLRNGSELYKNGFAEVNGASSELVTASGSIIQALATINNGLAESTEDMDLSELTQLPTMLTQVANGLNGMTDGISTFKEEFSKANSALDDAVASIPDQVITEEEFGTLYSSIENPENLAVINKLKDTYIAAQKVKGTYYGVGDVEGVKVALEAVNPTLTQLSEGITQTADGLITAADEIATSTKEMDIQGSMEQLQIGLGELASQYGQFHTGLVGYTQGINQLSTSYSEIHSGIVDMSGGTGDLEDGVGELHDGTSTLYDSTSDLPEQIQEEVDKMIDEFDKSDFKPVSFVSTENEKINSVQFVIKTKSIEKVEEEENEEKAAEEETGFWARLLKLFK